MVYYDRNKFANLPKRPVKTFQDLDVYQQALEGNVFIAKAVITVINKAVVKSERSRKPISAGARDSIAANIGIGMAICSSTIPHQIAEAHSFRFGSQKECLILLEKVMLNCNKMVVYLDQARDICETGLEIEKFTELQKKYLLIRRKVLNLQRAWQKYMHPAADVAPAFGSQSHKNINL